MSKKIKEHGIGNFAMLVPKSPRGMQNMGTVMHGGSLLKGSKKESKEDAWNTMPKGWTSASRDKFASTLTGMSAEAKLIAHDLECEAKKEAEAGDDPMPGFVDKCMDRIGGHVDDPGAFCAALKDRVTGTTHWRREG